MAVKMNLWSMTLLPGEKYPMLVRRDFQITNVALGEELRDESGRSVVKVTHNPIDPAAFDTDSEIDSDFEDSDDEFDMDGEDSVDEEVDDEEEVDVEAKKKVKAVAKEALKAAEDAEMDEDDEDEDEDEEDDEELDSDDEEALEVNVICSLLAGKVEQAQVNLTFVEGEVVMFEASGENAVHLLGNYIDQFPDVDSDSEFDSDEDDYDDYSALYDDEDDEDESGPEIEELEEEAEVEVKPKKAIKAAAAAPAAKEEKAAPTSLKRKSEAVESPAGKTAEAAAAASGEGLSKAQKKKLAKKAKLDGADAAPAPAAAAEKPKPKAQNAPQKRTTASGLIIEDITVGTGPVAKGGKRLGMRYIGKLTSGKQFDANTAGKPFSFVLGRGEVIKGWDEGLVGMAVGGERRLTIPPQLAYGKRASGPIPANSTLKFDVKLVSIN